MKIYHNARCGKSRKALQLVNEANVDIEVFEYLKESLTAADIKSVLSKLGMNASELLRKNEAIYKEKYKGKELSEAQWIDAMIQYPKLIERPILIKGDKAIVARPPEKVLDFIK